MMTGKSNYKLVIVAIITLSFIFGVFNNLPVIEQRDGSDIIEVDNDASENKLSPKTDLNSINSPGTRGSTINVAIYDHANTGDVSYWTGGNANSFNTYQSILTTDPQSRFSAAIITTLTPGVLANYDALILPDNSVPNIHLTSVSNWFGINKGIICADSAVCYAAFSGFMFPPSAGSNGNGVYWSYSSTVNDQQILISHKITENYAVNQIITSQSFDAEMFSAMMPGDSIKLTAKSTNNNMIYVGARDVPSKGKIVVLGPYDDPIAPTYNNLYDLIRDAVEWSVGNPNTLELDDGGGANSDTCYAKYKAYTFNATILTQTGLANVSYVNITLDYGPGEENLKYSWDAVTDNFTEISDPNDYAEIKSTSNDSTNNSVDKWFIDFKIIFNWTYPDEQLSDGFLEITLKNNNYDNATYIDLFKIENDMMFRGTLSVTAQYQGALSKGDWVIGNEQINWTGYKVTYQGTTNVYVNGSYYNVSISDDDTGAWKDSPNTSEPFLITTQADPLNDISDVNDIDIVDLPAGATDQSKKNFTVRVDTINVTFADPVPYSGGWATGFNPTCKITINDTAGSGVNVSSIEYRNSTDGPGNYGPWQNANLTGSGTSYIASANPSFIVGNNNYIQWRAKDAVGNGFENSSDIQVKIEMIPPDNSGASITIDNGAVYSNDTILDFVFLGFTDGGGSGLEGYYYAFANNETTTNGTWDPDSPGQLVDAVQGLVYVYVWAKDFANNLGNSVSDSIFVDSKKPKLEDISPTPDQWQKSAMVACYVFVNDTVLGSRINVSSIEYRISTNGIGNYGNWLSAGASGSGTQLPVTVNPTFAEGTNNYIQWRAKDIVDHQRISGHNQLKIDQIDITYSNLQPSFWQTSQSVTCSAKIEDLGGSGVDTSTIEYAFSTTGLSGYGGWQNLGKAGVVQSTYVYTTEIFGEGTNNYIKWRASDQANNQLTSPDIQIKVDTINLTFTDPIPIDDVQWQTDTIVTCGITVNDIAGSTVNASSISYRYSTSGIGNYSEWISAQKIGDGETIICTEDVNFYDGTDNYIKWGAKDLAGNWYESLDFKVNVDTGNLTFSNAVPQFYQWNLVSDVECGIDIKDTGPSGIDTNSIQYQISTSGITGFEAWQSVDSNDISGTGAEVAVNITVTLAEGKQNYIRWRVADLAGNSKVSNIYQILVDTEGIVFQDPLPIGSAWEHTLTITCGVTATDANSGVDAGTIEYSYSITGTSPESFGGWTSAKKIKDGSSVTCTADLNFEEGTENYIRWRAKDVAGSSHTLSDIYQIKIDTQNIAYSDVSPTGEVWQTATLVEFQITIEDNAKGSGLNLSTIQYSISTKGMAGYSELDYGDWVLANTDPSTKLVLSKDGLSCIGTLDLTLPEGVSNYIKWYAEDYAGNGLESEDYRIMVDTIGPDFYEPYPEPQEWQTGGLLVTCEIFVADVGESALDLTTLEFSYSKTGLSGFGNWQDNWLELSRIEDGTNIDNTSGIEIVKVSTPTLKLQEGTENYIQWRGYDNAGNYQESERYQIMIDTEELTYRESKVKDTTKHENGDTVSFTFETTLDDTGGSGVDLSTIEYATSNEGNYNFGDWKSLWATAAPSEIPTDGETYTATVTDTVEKGGGVIYIKIRAKDVAGNGYTESEASLVLGNSVPTPLISLPKDGAKFYKGETINFDASGSFDGDEDQLEFTWYSNVSGEIGNGAQLSTSLEPGHHRITVRVSDGYNPEVSSGVTITVSSEPESEPDLFEGGTGIALIIILIVIIIIVILIFLLIIKRRKKLLEEEEAPGDVPEAPSGDVPEGGEPSVETLTPPPPQLQTETTDKAEQAPQDGLSAPPPPPIPPGAQIGAEDQAPLEEPGNEQAESDEETDGVEEPAPPPPKVKPTTKPQPKITSPPKIKPKVKPPAKLKIKSEIED